MHTNFRAAIYVIIFENAELVGSVNRVLMGFSNFAFTKDSEHLNTLDFINNKTDVSNYVYFCNILDLDCTDTYNNNNYSIRKWINVRIN